MKGRWTRYWAALILGGLFIAATRVFSHEFQMESVMNAFVTVEPREAHLVIRLPLHLLKTVQIPTEGREIDLVKAEPAIQRALAALGREVTLAENGRALVPATAIGRLSLPSDRSFNRYEDALAHVAQPMPRDQGIYPEQGFFDAHLTYAIASPSSHFTIRTAVAPELKDYLKLTLRFARPGEKSRAMVITSRSGTVALDPAWYEAAASFVQLGFLHILSGVDHLLFLLCLVLTLRGWRQILAIITMFTVAHSVTLLGAAYGFAPRGAWFPPFVETAIAATIVYTALENIVGMDLRRRWVVTGLFGLVHGFGFSYGLQENLQFAGQYLVTSLLAFNIGIELGQVAALLVMLPAIALLRRDAARERIGVIILSALVVNTAWDWMMERASILWKVEWPPLDGPAIVVLARWAAGVLIVVGAVSLVARRRAARGSSRLPGSTPLRS
jgi:hypothetical protein